MGRVKGKHISIYVPIGFKATWEIFLKICERDGTNAATEIRKYVELQVKRRAPGNPQPPLTAFMSGHRDELTKKRSDVLKACITRAQEAGGEVRHRDIISMLMDGGWAGSSRLEVAESLEEDLKKFGVAVVY